MFNINNFKGPLSIGLTGTNLQYQIKFDVSSWFKKWPNAGFSIFYTRPKISEDETGYFVDTECLNGILTWFVKYPDVEFAGKGKFEIHASVPGTNTLYAKAGPFEVDIAESIGESSGEIPETMAPWTQRIESAAADALLSKATAQAAATTATNAKNDALTAKFQAIDAANAAAFYAAGASSAKSEAEQAAQQAEQSVTHPPIIDENTKNWALWDFSESKYIVTDFPSEGPKGEEGERGEQGEAGFSPTVTVQDIPSGHRVIITDASGAHSFDVLDGSGGGTQVIVSSEEPVDAKNVLWFDTSAD